MVTWKDIKEKLQEESMTLDDVKSLLLTMSHEEMVAFKKEVEADYYKEEFEAAINGNGFYCPIPIGDPNHDPNKFDPAWIKNHWINLR